MTLLLRRLTVHWPLAAICLLYLGLTSIYSFCTPAWEANDEISHVANIEYFLQHGEWIPLRTQRWNETHQPPLYYLVAGGWQRLLGVPAFAVVHPAGRNRGVARGDDRLYYTHVYSPEEREAAVALHKLRLLGLLFGLGTVLLTYGVGILATADKGIALSAAAFVAVLPKFNVISAMVTNDSLVVMFCSLGLFLALLARKTSSDRRLMRALVLLGLGATAGAAMITKLNSLPVVCFLLVSTLFGPSVSMFRRGLAFCLTVAGLAITSGWWMLLNYTREGTLLGQRETEDWLERVTPGLISVVPWTDGERFLKFVPSHLLESVWYIGGWNQFILPLWVNLILSLLAGAAFLVVAKAYLKGSARIRKFDSKVLLLAGCCVMALAAVLIIARTTTQAEGRVAYVGLSAFAVLASLGSQEAWGSRPKTEALSFPEKRFEVALFAWPLLLLALNLYVLSRFVMPFAGL